jgi:hypothetical protein
VEHGLFRLQKYSAAVDFEGFVFCWIRCIDNHSLKGGVRIDASIHPIWQRRCSLAALPTKQDIGDAIL